MLSVCITRPVPGIAKYRPRCRAVFHANVPTRPPGEIPRLSIAAATRRVSAAISANVLRSSPVAVFVVTVFVP